MFWKKKKATKPDVKLDTTLIDMDRTPTMEELRAFFKKHDWSAMKLDVDHEKFTPEDADHYKYLKELIHEKWEPLSREMGLKASSEYYGDDNPLIAMRDNFENLVSDATFKLIEEEPKKAREIIRQAMSGPNGVKDPDRFLHNAVETTMKVMNYEELAQIIQGDAAFEDFSSEKSNNYRAKDFERKWNHTRTAASVSYDELASTDSSELADASTDIEEAVSQKLNLQDFWNGLTDEDKMIVKLKMDGVTQEEIAKRLSFKTHSAVTKRLAKLRERFSDYE